MFMLYVMHIVCYLVLPNLAPISLLLRNVWGLFITIFHLPEIITVTVFRDQHQPCVSVKPRNYQLLAVLNSETLGILLGCRLV